MKIPANLKWLASHRSGRAWLERLPQLVSDLAERWDLELGEAYAGSYASYVAPALRAGERVVLKVQWPHEECTYEADALEVWNGDGAVRLLAHDRERGGLLLEHCSPGTHLADSERSHALPALIGLLPRLWKPAGPPFKTLAEEAEEWRSGLIANWEAAGKPFERELVDAAAGYLTELPANQGEQVLLHQDLHGGNVLAAEREPWLVIDPKPLAGEREFAAAPIVRSFELGHSRAQVLDRLDRLSTELGLDRERCRGWTIAQTVAWSIDSNFAKQHVETARWLLESH